MDVCSLLSFCLERPIGRWFWAFSYNTLAVILAVTGVLAPIVTAGAMLISSLSVIANSMRLQRGEGGQ